MLVHRLICSDIPDVQLALGNQVFVSPFDFCQPLKLMIESTVFDAQPHPLIPGGHIAMNAIQRGTIHASTNCQLLCQPFVDDVPDMSNVILFCDPRVPSNLEEFLDRLHEQFEGQVFRRRQAFVMQHDDQLLLLLVGKQEPFDRLPIHGFKPGWELLGKMSHHTDFTLVSKE